MGSKFINNKLDIDDENVMNYYEQRFIKFHK